MLMVNTLRPRRNEQHFADDIFKRIFFNKNVWISIKISLKFVPKGPINNIPALVQIMAWRRSGDKPLSEPMMVSLPTHICVTRPQWVNDVSGEMNHDVASSYQTCWNNVIDNTCIRIHARIFFNNAIQNACTFTWNARTHLETNVTKFAHSSYMGRCHLPIYVCMSYEYAH